MSADDGLWPGVAVGPAGDDPVLAMPDQRTPEAAQSRASMATLYDVARLAGVSTATVSRVVHGQDRVRAATRERVQQVIEELGYVPDGAAQSLSRRRKNVIGLVCVEHVGLTPKQYDIESMSLLFYDEVLRGVEARLRGIEACDRDHDLSLLITYLREDTDFDWVRAPVGGPLSFYPRLMALSGKVDGLLIGEGIVPTPVLARLAARLPVVVIAGDPSERAADVVTADNRGGAVALVTHLISDHGRRRLYYVDGPPTAPDAKERRLALADVLRAHPEAELAGSYDGLFSVQSGEDAAAALLARSGTLPDAVICANDQMAIGVLQALATAGVRVPEDMAVTGFDDIFVGGLVEPTLTTVHQPMRQLGEQACARLLERIATPSLPPTVQLLPTELVLRSSCGCPRGTATRHVIQSAEVVHPADTSPAPVIDGRRASSAPV